MFDSISICTCFSNGERMLDWAGGGHNGSVRGTCACGKDQARSYNNKNLKIREQKLDFKKTVHSFNMHRADVLANGSLIYV